MLCLAIETFRTYAQSASAFRERWPVIRTVRASWRDVMRAR